MSGRYAAWLVVVIALTAGCSATGQPADEPKRNATLSLSGYEHTGGASSIERRVFYDRSRSWENPGNRTVVATSRASTYSNASGTDTAVVYTTLNRPYVGSDRVRSLPAPDMADLATRPVETRPLGNASGSSYRAVLLDEEATVRTVTRAGDETTAHVAHVTRDDAIVVVVVVGDVDRSTAERVLGGVTLRGSSARSD